MPPPPTPHVSQTPWIERCANCKHPIWAHKIHFCPSNWTGRHQRINKICDDCIMCYPKRGKYSRCVAGVPRRPNGKPPLMAEDVDGEVELGRKMDEISVSGSEESEESEVGDSAGYDGGDEDEGDDDGEEEGEMEDSLGEDGEEEGEIKDDAVTARKMCEEEHEALVMEEGSGGYSTKEQLHYALELVDAILEELRRRMGK